MQRPIAIDLFSGCGGMSLGLEAAGFDIAASVEFDAVHMLVHHFNFPYSVSICQDIRQLQTQDLMAKIREQKFFGEIDLIAGGPPCQGFSSMGKRQVDDPRNSLIFEYLRIVREIRPKYFIFENVPGLVSGESKLLFNRLICEFEGIDYRIAKPVKILDSSKFGAPQKRKRLILMGSRKDVPKVKYPPMVNQVMAKGNSTGEMASVAEAISDLEAIDPFIGYDSGIEADRLNYSAFRKSFSLDPSGEYRLCHRRTTDGRVWGHIGSQHRATSIQRFSETAPETFEKTSHLFKLSSSGLCNTLRAGTSRDKGAYTAPRPIHYSKPRCITVREAARLHTFPDWFQFHQTIWHGFREIGNAVIPMLSKALGMEIIQCLNIDRDQLEIKDLPKGDRRYLSLNMQQACKYWQIPNTVIPPRKRQNKSKE